jgi:PAS domain S-box-containing protein
MGSEAQWAQNTDGSGFLQTPTDGFSPSDFRLLAEHLTHMVWICRPDGTLEYMNPHGLGYFGVALREAVTSFPCGLLSHPDDREQSRISWQHAIESQQPLNIETRLLCADGAFRWHLIRAEPVRDGTGRVVKWMGTSTNVDSARADHALAVSEQRLRLAQAMAQIGAWELDPEAQSIRLSEESHELFGLNENAGTSLYQLWVSLIDPRDRNALGDLLRECSASGTAEAEFRYRHPTRGPRWIHCRAGSVADGTHKSIVGISLDVTARRKAEEELKEVNQRKDEFLAMLAHELRNPLAPIRNAAQILRAHSTGQPELEWARTVIERQTRHLVRLVDDLLDVSRMIRGKIVLRKSSIEISELIQHAVDTSQPLIRARRHRLHVNLPPGSLTIDGDLTRLAQALANLLNNAAKYTDEGGQIWVDVWTEGERVVLRVRDTGPGIAPALLPHVFDLFTQAERTLDRAQGGLGVGLTLVKLLTEMHGGTVEARNSQAGHGAEFIVRLPANVGESAHSRSSQRAPSGTELQHAHKRPVKILIVDDNVDAADSIALLLTMDGFEAHSVHGAMAALDTVGSFKPDVVLLDIGLPVMDGYELAQRLRAHIPVGQMRIVALSGYGQQADRDKASLAGFDDYLVKPVEPKLLSEFLRGLR